MKIAKGCDTCYMPFFPYFFPFGVFLSVGYTRLNKCFLLSILWFDVNSEKLEQFFPFARVTINKWPN